MFRVEVYKVGEIFVVQRWYKLRTDRWLPIGGYSTHDLAHAPRGCEERWVEEVVRVFGGVPSKRWLAKMQSLANNLRRAAHTTRPDAVADLMEEADRIEADVLHYVENALSKRVPTSATIKLEQACERAPALFRGEEEPVDPETVLPRIY